MMDILIAFFFGTIFGTALGLLTMVLMIIAKERDA